MECPSYLVATALMSGRGLQSILTIFGYRVVDRAAIDSYINLPLLYSVQLVLSLRSQSFSSQSSFSVSLQFSQLVSQIVDSY